MSRFTKNLIITVFLIIASFVAVNFSLAQGVDTGMSFGQQIGLSNTDPRIVVANVIRIALGFLGIIAVGLIMYAGWLYMTAAGEEEKIEKAKKLLISAVIGLVIILSSFAIASFIISKMLDATGGTSTEVTTPGPGDGTIPGGGAIPGGDDPAVLVSCSDSDTSCVANNTKCEEGYHCDASCVCEPGGGYGESCDSVSSSPSCEADNDLCSAYLTCDAATCTCLGAPVIEWVSPIDESNTPNGKPGNMITIGGRYFGDTPGKVYFFDRKEAQFPDAPCDNNWQDDQIIVLVPAGAANGLIRVVRADGVEDTTSNNRGPVINDFVKNSITRPGICKITPSEGKMNDPINYYGLGLSGGIAYFGSASSKIVALNSVFSSDVSGMAKVSNIGTGNTSAFVLNGGEFSNYLDFKKNAEPEIGPKITSFEPKEGAPGQYVTIHGSGFGAVRGSSEVNFGGASPIPADLTFPTACGADSVWSDKQVIVKVPVGSTTDKITMTIGSKMISSGEIFTTKTGSPGPSLCKIEPIAGPKNSAVSLWGEYFGAEASSKVIFNSKKEQARADMTSWGKDGEADKIETKVHLEATNGDGQVKVAQGVAESNGMNFAVGNCIAGGCGISSVCCPADSSEKGKCIAGANLSVCYTAVTSSVYEWEFATGSSGAGGGCAVGQTVCGTSCCAGTCSDPSTNTCAGTSCSPLNTCGTECCAVACVSGACPISPCAVGQTVCGTSCCAGACSDPSTNTCAGVACSSPQITCGSECCAVGVASCDGITGKCSKIDRPGAKCVGVDNLSCNTGFCGGTGSYYSCIGVESPDFSVYNMDSCGICCCNPDIGSGVPQTNANGLRCVADKSPCGGANRGLYCGCKEDRGCGSTATIDKVGCGSVDTCCRERPTITGVYPETTDVCPNTLISATFSEKMNISSFAGNVIVVGDYTGACPADTQYISLERNIPNKNIFARAYGKIAGVFKKISMLFKGDTALAVEQPVDAHNYCAVTGIVNGADNADGTTKLTFNLNKSLDANRKYYVIIKGYEEADSGKGVLSSWGVGFNGDLSNLTSDWEFNHKKYPKAKIWSFETGGNVAGEEDCKLNNITVSPASYLFKAVGKTQSFFAEPHSKNGQIITPTSAYNWTWSWSSVDDTTAAVSNSGSPVSPIQTVTAGNVQDKKTFIKATASVSPSVTGQAEVYVFLCENPWPPIVAGVWAPWNDASGNCAAYAGGNCNNFNYGLYYCRDAGAPGPAGDLPAILSNKTILRGANSLVCVGDTGACSALDADCGSSSPLKGKCKYNILKEAYFFREALPDVTGINLTASPLAEGKKVELGWTPVTPPAGEVLAGYKIYYGTASGKYTKNISVAKTENSYPVDGLNNGQIYYFSMVALYESGAVSGYSKEASATPQDTTAPADPAVSAAPGDKSVALSWTSSDATNFEVYYKAIGATETCGSGVSFAVPLTVNNKKSTIIPNLTNGARYCFGIKAYDLDNNPSAMITVASIPFTAPKNLSATAGTVKVDLAWEAAAGAVSYKIYYGTTPGNYITSVSESGTSRSMSGMLAPGTTYYFAVKSVNVDGSESAYSNEASAIPKAP